MSKSAQKVHVIRPQGDLIVQILRGDVVELMLVSAQVMAHASSRLAYTLATLGKASVRPLFTMKQVVCTEVDGDVLLLLCNILHERFEQVPQTMTIQGLESLASICLRYGVSGDIIPWARRWFGHLYYTANVEAKNKLLDVADRLMSSVGAVSHCRCSAKHISSALPNMTGEYGSEVSNINPHH